MNLFAKAPVLCCPALLLRLASCDTALFFAFELIAEHDPRAVLQDPKSYEEMRNALGLLKLLAQGEEDIRKGNICPQEEVFSDLERLASG